MLGLAGCPSDPSPQVWEFDVGRADAVVDKGTDRGTDGSRADAAGDAALDMRIPTPMPERGTPDAVVPDAALDAAAAEFDASVTGDGTTSTVAPDNEPDDVTTPTLPGIIVNEFLLAVNECFDRVEDLTGGRLRIITTKLPCDEPHRAQVFGKWGGAHGSAGGTAARAAGFGLSHVEEGSGIGSFKVIRSP